MDSLNCSSVDGSNELLYAELYDKFLKLENETKKIIELTGKLTNIIDFIIKTSNTNNGIQTRINNDIIIILCIILYLFSKIK